MVTGVDTALQKRFFYHSFPRRGKNTDSEIERGCKILTLIRDCGLLLTPEVVKWEYPHADGSPPRKNHMVQRRMSFTELAPSQLKGHANEFGHFALEFEIDTLKNLGAIPVFYVPNPGTLASPLGQTLVMQLIDAMCLVDRLSKVKKFIESTCTVGSRQDFTFGFSDRQKLFSLDVSETQRALEGITHAITPVAMLSLGLEGALNFFYPTDDARDNNGPLKYYRQREWRITGNIGFGGEGLMRLPSPELINALLELDAPFFGREFPPPGLAATNPSLVSPPPPGVRLG
jgi:hypothetical protein